MATTVCVRACCGSRPVRRLDGCFLVSESSYAREAIVSAVTPWEVAIEVAAGKPRLKNSPIEWFSKLAERYELVELPLDLRIACAAAALPPIHRDPFDRVLVALSGDRALTILTSDENIPKYPGVRTIW